MRREDMERMADAIEAVLLARSIGGQVTGGTLNISTSTVRFWIDGVIYRKVMRGMADRFAEVLSGWCVHLREEGTRFVLEATDEEEAPARAGEAGVIADVEVREPEPKGAAIKKVSAVWRRAILRPKQ